MHARTPIRYATAVLALSTAALLPAAAFGQTAQPEKWQYWASIYAYLPSISGQTTFPSGSGGSGINVDADTIIDNLKFTFMGSFDMHNGRWGAFTDVIYLNVGGDKAGSRDFTIGNIGLPGSTSANLNLDLKGWLWTVAGEYRVVSDPSFKMDLLAGARYFDVKQKLDWNISGDIGPLPAGGRSGSSEVSVSVWDAIVGLKGRYSFGSDRQWLVPFYVDVGTGQSDLTWQAAGGLGYSFSWGEINAMWRYLDYKFGSDKRIQDMNFNGPMIGLAFRW